MRLPVFTSLDWQDYELLDSGDGRKLERFGPVTLVRPEAQAVWPPALPAGVWSAADAVFQTGDDGQELGWQLRRAVQSRWPLSYKALHFWVQIGESRQVGVFPENATHWDWTAEQVNAAGREVHVLNLFGYTGLASLAAAQAGARVTHVDASRKAVAWGRENQALSGLADRPIRWVVEDALTYLGREARRGVRYDGVIMDPPAFGRGPDGEIWRFARLFPALCGACRAILSNAPLFVVATIYTKGVTPQMLRQQAGAMLAGFEGALTIGKLATVERSAGRVIDNALVVRWRAR